MAVGMILEWESGFDREKYVAISQRVGTENRLADGCLSHAVGFAQDGNAYVAEVWESQEKANAFGELSGPAVAEVGFPPPSKVTIFETFRFDCG